MRKNDIVELEISSVSNLGCGVGRIPDTDADGGMVVFVPGAVSGDRVRAKISGEGGYSLLPGSGKLRRVRIPFSEI